MERKIALITGATSGIGEACARKFVEGGYDLILTGRNVEKLKAVEEQARRRGADVLPLVFDVRDRKAATSAVESLQGKWAVIDVLINNAGLALGLEKEYEGDMDDWETMIDNISRTTSGCSEAMFLSSCKSVSRSYRNGTPFFTTIFQFPIRTPI